MRSICDVTRIGLSQMITLNCRFVMISRSFMHGQDELRRHSSFFTIITINCTKRVFEHTPYFQSETFVNPLTLLKSSLCRPVWCHGPFPRYEIRKNAIKKCAREDPSSQDSRSGEFFFSDPTTRSAPLPASRILNLNLCQLYVRSSAKEGCD